MFDDPIRLTQNTANQTQPFHKHQDQIKVLSMWPFRWVTKSMPLSVLGEG